MAKAAKRSKPPRRKLKRGKAPAALVKKLRQLERGQAPAEIAERLRQFERGAEAHWDKMPKVSVADRAEDSRALLIRDGFASPSKPAPSRPAPTAERGETMTREVLRYIADKHYSKGRPRLGSQPVSWRSFALHIKRHWDKACDALGLPSSERPDPPDPRTVSRFFQQRDARG
jgi:hypothetical protein